MNIRDSLDFCNICETDFDIEVEVEDGYTAVFDVEDEPYRGAYCQSCWDELMTLERKLWKEKYDKRGTSRLLLFPTDTVSTKKSRSNE